MIDMDGGGGRDRRSVLKTDPVREGGKHKNEAREKGGEGAGRRRRSWRLLTEAERKMGGEVEGSCRWTV